MEITDICKETYNQETVYAYTVSLTKEPGTEEK